MFTVWHLILNLTLLISLNLGRRKLNADKKHKLLLNRRHEGGALSTKRLIVHLIWRCSQTS